MLWIISFVLIVRPERLNSHTTGQYIIKILKKDILLTTSLNLHFHLPVGFQFTLPFANSFAIIHVARWGVVFSLFCKNVQFIRK